jgi:hypothetical protein
MTDERPPEYLAAELQQRLATDPRVAELGLDVEVQDASIIVRGRLGGADCRAQVQAVMAEAAPGYDIVVDVECVDLAEPDASRAEAL